MAIINANGIISKEIEIKSTEGGMRYANFSVVENTYKYIKKEWKQVAIF